VLSVTLETPKLWVFRPISISYFSFHILVSNLFSKRCWVYVKIDECSTDANFASSINCHNVPLAILFVSDVRIKFNSFRWGWSILVQVSLCVKRLVYTNDQGEIVKGVCSNFLCKAEWSETIFMKAFCLCLSLKGSSLVSRSLACIMKRRVVIK
jgi:hypothetical protein